MPRKESNSARGDILISVVIPVYNRADFVSLALQSVMAQTNKNWECIVVDDGSTDATKKVVGDYIKKDTRIRYLYKENGGQGSARNIGIRQARGKYIIPLDSDDILLSGMMTSLVGAAESGGFDVVSGKDWVVSFKERKIKNIGDPNPSCTLYKNELFDEFCYYSESRDLIGVEDVDLDFQWLLLGKMGRRSILRSSLDIPLVIYLQHEGQMTDPMGLNKWEKRTVAMLEKYKETQAVQPSWMALKYRELAHIKMLLGKKKAAMDFFKKSLSFHSSPQTFFLFAVAQGGSAFYCTVVLAIKKIRQGIFFRARVIKYTGEYPLLYREVVNWMRIMYKD
jgi:glycosyltransferase involved in cell wall biosynthesis